MLVCYARELKDAFSDYTEEVVKLMVPLLKFYFHDGVRTAAVEALPYLLECAKVKGPQYVQVLLIRKGISLLLRIIHYYECLKYFVANTLAK